MNTHLDIRITKNTYNTIFEFIWAIDESNADNIFKHIFENFYWNILLFDFNWLEYWNSKFIWYLIKMKEFIDMKWWEFSIVNPNEKILDTLESCWIHKIIPIIKIPKEI